MPYCGLENKVRDIVGVLLLYLLLSLHVMHSEDSLILYLFP